MNRLLTYVCCLFLFLLISPAKGDVSVTLQDGRKALLKNDFTWEYIDSPDQINGDVKEITLSVERKVTRNDSCHFGLRLYNSESYGIRHIVLRFSAITKRNVVFDTLSRGFSEIKPTENQYKSITFRGISCDEISALKVHGGDRCAMGSLTKVSSEKGECLKRIGIKKSELINVFKEE